MSDHPTTAPEKHASLAPSRLARPCPAGTWASCPTPPLHAAELGAAARPGPGDGRRRDRRRRVARRAAHHRALRRRDPLARRRSRSSPRSSTTWRSAATRSTAASRSSPASSACCPGRCSGWCCTWCSISARCFPYLVANAATPLAAVIVGEIPKLDKTYNVLGVAITGHDAAAGPEVRRVPRRARAAGVRRQGLQLAQGDHERSRSSSCSAFCSLVAVLYSIADTWVEILSGLLQVRQRAGRRRRPRRPRRGSTTSSSRCGRAAGCRTSTSA